MVVFVLRCHRRFAVEAAGRLGRWRASLVMGRFSKHPRSTTVSTHPPVSSILRRLSAPCDCFGPSGSQRLRATRNIIVQPTVLRRHSPGSPKVPHRRMRSIHQLRRDAEVRYRRWTGAHVIESSCTADVENQCCRPLAQKVEGEWGGGCRGSADRSRQG